MDETESGAHRGRLGRQGWTAEMEIRAEAARLEPRERAEFLERQGLTAPMVWTDEMERWARTGRLDPLVSPGHPDPPGLLARAGRRVSAVRRATRVTREILARLAKRVNL